MIRWTVGLPLRLTGSWTSLADNAPEQGGGDGQLYVGFAVRRENRMACRNFHLTDTRLSIHRLWPGGRDWRAFDRRRCRRARGGGRHLSEANHHPRVSGFAALAVLEADAQSRLARGTRTACSLSRSDRRDVFFRRRRALGRCLFAWHLEGQPADVCDGGAGDAGCDECRAG